MKRTTRRLVWIATLVWGLIAVSAMAQRVTQPALRGNPYRDAGGSCLYGRNGELLHAPKGEVCPTREEAPGARAPDSSVDYAGLPPELRNEANALVGSHAHVANHLAELRRAVAVSDQTKALDLTDEVTKELIDHLAREQALFDKLEEEHRAH